MPASPFQPLAAEDFVAAVDRLILTRWIAAALVLAFGVSCVRVLAIPLPFAPMMALGGVLAVYNGALAAIMRRLASTPEASRVRWLRHLVIAQVELDWLAMTVFVHLTGGIVSPAISVFLIHMLIVTVLLPEPSPYLYVALAAVALIAVASLEATGALPHHGVLPLPEGLHRDPRVITAQVAFFSGTAVVTVHLTLLVVTRLRERDRQVEALLEAAHAAGSSLDLDEVLNRLVESAARALSAKAVSIRLLDRTGERMEMIAATGLSERYLDKGYIKASHSAIEWEALTGKPVIVADVERDPRLRYARDHAEEGIGSILVVPVTGRTGPLGALRVYAAQADAFFEADVAFARSVAAQGAVAIENALAHDALQRAERTRSQFVRTVTHELRSPIAGALTLLRVVLDGLVGDLAPQPRDMLSRAAARLAHLTELVNDLLDLAASRSVELQEKPAPVDVTAALRGVVEQFRGEAGAKGLELVLDAPGRPVVVRATDRGLSRIFGNLVSNAVKYTASGGRVEVQAALQGGGVTVKVADTGIGIPEEDLPNLWQDFFRASNARRSETVGTGLGLALVKRLVTSFGGVVGVQSAVGRGSTFTVTLPLAAPEAVGAQAPAPLPEGVRSAPT